MMRLLVFLALAVRFALHRRTPGGDGPGRPPDAEGRPSQQHGSVNASEGVTSAQNTTERIAQRGRPSGEGRTGEHGGDLEGSQPRLYNLAEPPPGVRFDDPKRPNLGSDGKYYIEEGVDHDVPIEEPGNPSRTITDIDRPGDGVLWEEKSAVNASDVNKWMNKQVINKIEAYIEARRYIAGYEHAPVGIEFTRAGVDPAFRAAVEKTIADLRIKHPDVTILVKWAE